MRREAVLAARHEGCARGYPLALDSLTRSRSPGGNAATSLAVARLSAVRDGSHAPLANVTTELLAREGRMMNPSFGEQLTAIRRKHVASAAAAKSLGSRVAVGNDREDRVELFLRCREQMQAIIEGCHRALQRVAPSFELKRGFYEATYAIVIAIAEHRRDANDRTRKYFSGITFFLAPRLAEQTFDVTCKVVIRNRELEPGHTTRRPGEDAADAFRQFVEAQFCRLAEAFFTDDDTLPVSVVPIEDGSVRVWT